MYKCKNLQKVVILPPTKEQQASVPINSLVTLLSTHCLYLVGLDPFLLSCLNCSWHKLDKVLETKFLVHVDKMASHSYCRFISSRYRSLVPLLPRGTLLDRILMTVETI